MDQLFDFTPIFDNFGFVMSGFWVTLKLTLLSALLSMILGTILVGFRVSPIPLLRTAGTIYVNALRNTPLTLVLVLCGLGLNDALQLHLGDGRASYFAWGVLGLSAYTAAFVCEGLRSGVNTVPLGQAEAARAIGLTFGQSLRLIILPQAFRAVIAPLGSVLIAMTKNTTVVIAVGYAADAAANMKEMFDDYGASLAIFIGFALGYMVLTLPTGFFFGWLAKRMAVAR